MGPELALISTVVGGAFSLFGQMQQGQAAAEQARYQAAVARNNQIIAEQNARYAATAGEAKAQASDFKNRAFLGAIEAAQGASGIALDSETLQDVREGAAQIGRLDTATIMHDAMLQSRSFNIQGQNFGNQAQLEEMRGRNSGVSSLISGFGSILGSATSFSDKWMRYQIQGVPGY